MMPTVRRAAVVALLVSATPLAAQRSERRVIDRAAIAAAGWHRVGDLVNALPPGSTASVDGFNHELGGSRLGFIATTGNRATWALRLDGQPMPMHVGGIWILDLVPVAITQIDSIVITEGPTLADGRSELLGVIDLYTRRPRRGMSALADYQHGDESGDPGPYRYTPRATPNVEKIGPFASGAAAFGSSRIDIDGAARYSSMNTTDERIASRVGSTFPTLQTDVNASGGSGVATIDAAGGSHYLVAGRGRFTGLFYAPFSDTYSQMRVVATQGGASGTLNAVQRTWRYSASMTKLDAEPLGGAAMPATSGERLFTDAFLETQIVSALRVGLGWNRVEQTNSGTTRQRDAERGWIAHAVGPWSAELAAERLDGVVRGSGTVQYDRRIADSNAFHLAFTSLVSPRRNDDVWMETCATPPDCDGGDVRALELRAGLSTRALWMLRPTWYARGYSYSDVGAARRVDGIAAGLVASSPPGRVEAMLRAEVNRLIGDSVAGSRSTPGGFAEGSVRTVVAGGFHLAVSGRYAPSTEWPSRGSFPATGVPETRRIDLSANKSMWSDRIRAQLVMRNALNEPDRTHPFGAQWNLRTHVAVTVALPSGASR